jgi:8-oxo-dGTP pyrophosphatase MutT (NUDIX family)
MFRHHTTASVTRDFYKNTKPPPFARSKARFFNTEEPIISFGIVCFFIDSDIPNILLYQRRDTFGYVDIIKGFWSSDSDIEKLFLLTTKDERERLENYDFEEIWDDLWVDHSHYIYKKEYKHCLGKFEQVKIFMNSKKYEELEFPENKLEWGFPKGKKIIKESNLDCALREFEEETTISRKKLFVFDRDNPMIEYYRGSDNRAYGTYYFLCEIKKKYIPLYEKLPDRIRPWTLSSEAKTFDWFTIAKANRTLITHHKKILKKAVVRIEKILCNRRFSETKNKLIKTGKISDKLGLVTILANDDLDTVATSATF